MLMDCLIASVILRASEASRIICKYSTDTLNLTGTSINPTVGIPIFIWYDQREFQRQLLCPATPRVIADQQTSERAFSLELKRISIAGHA
jgi:hypothetical protein